MIEDIRTDIDHSVIDAPPFMRDRSQGIDVLCIDGERAFGDALAVAIGVQPGVASVVTGSTVDEALEIVTRRPPHVVLMDIDLPGRSGLDGAARIKAIEPRIRVVLLTTMPTLELLLRAAASGADALLSKSGSFDEIVDALRRDEHGGIALNPSLISAVRANLSRDGGHGGWNPALSAREYDVLALLAEGLDPKTIAKRLDITLHTCRGYLRSILTKLGAHTQLEAVVVAARIGLVSVGAERANAS